MLMCKFVKILIEKNEYYQLVTTDIIIENS